MLHCRCHSSQGMYRFCFVVALSAWGYGATVRLPPVYLVRLSASTMDGMLWRDKIKSTIVRTPLLEQALYVQQQAPRYLMSDAMVALVGLGEG